MFIPIALAFLTFIFLIVCHELGHFLMAKIFRMRVDEFGFGFPPRLWSKKIGETLYSINLLPLGGFVKIYGEDDPESLSDPASFQNKPLFQRFLVVVAGVVAFWIIAIVLLSFLSGSWGLPSVVFDNAPDVKDVRIQITKVLENSPAQSSGLKPLDQILSLDDGKIKLIPKTIQEVQEFIKAHKGQEITLKIMRFDKELNLKVVPNQEGLIGIGLVRVGWQTFPWYLAPLKGIEATFKLTLSIVTSSFELLKKLKSGQPVEGADVRGPIGIGELFVQAFQIHPAYFVYFVALISIYLAIFNLLPIPALDGGRILFLVLEAIRGKQVSPYFEAKIHTAFFLILLALILVISVVDVLRILM